MENRVKQEVIDQIEELVSSFDVDVYSEHSSVIIECHTPEKCDEVEAFLIEDGQLDVHISGNSTIIIEDCDCID